MSNYQYPWEEIFQDCADLITVQIRDGKNVPETFPQLYQLFEKWYTEREKKVPEQRHFIRKMREELGVESGKKKIQPYVTGASGRGNGTFHGVQRILAVCSAAKQDQQHDRQEKHTLLLSLPQAKGKVSAGHPLSLL